MNLPDFKLTEIGEFAFAQSGLISLHIVASVTTIGQRLFNGCGSLETVTFPDDTKVTSLPVSLFANSGLINFTIPPPVENIVFSAFEGCERLKHVESKSEYFPVDNNGIVFNKDKSTLCYYSASLTGSLTIEDDNCTTIGHCSFHSSHLSSIIIKSPVTLIDSYSFAASTISSIEMPSTLTRIAGNAFSSCDGLVNVTIPESVTQMDKQCFAFCDNLENIYLPANLTIFGGGVFTNSPKVNIHFPETSNIYVNDDFFILDKNNETLSQYLGANTSILIPSTITKIKSMCFYEKDTIQSISFSIDSKLIEIEAYAFQSCTNLEIFDMPSKVEKIGTSAFQNCQKLKQINFPKTLILIEENAFFKCVDLSTVTFDDSENDEIIIQDNDGLEIKKQAFYLCKKLNITKFPSYLTSLGVSCFQECTSFTGPITIPEKVTNISDHCFYHSGITSITFLNNIEEIPDHLFADCSSLTDFSATSSLSKLGKYSFSNTGFVSFEIPQSVTFIDQYCFSHCSSLISLTIPEDSKLNDISYGAFSGCSSFSTITCAESSNFTIENEALYNKEKTKFFILPPNSSIQYFYFPQTLTTVGQGAMTDCIHVVVIFIPDNSVQTIDDYAFENCVNLRIINLPKCVQSVGSMAFKNCNKLQCGLLIDNPIEEFRQNLIKYSLLPSRCLESCIIKCTQCAKSFNHIPLAMFSIFLAYKL